MLVTNKRIYIIDDDESLRRALSILLSTYGFTAETFSCSDDFFKAVPDSSPGCLILDIYMPGLDGWETLRRIVESGSKRPVILVSAKTNGGTDKKAVIAGAVGFLQKPFNDQELIDLINKAY